MTDMISATYPIRGRAFYFNRYMAYVLRSGVALQYGCEAVTLLLSVALTEDKTRYSKAVQFWNDQLTAYLGCRVDRLNQIRKRLVDAEWLHYEPGRKGVAGRYWVLVPGGDDKLNDAALGDNTADVPTGSFPDGKAHTNAHRKPDDKAHRKPSPFLPTPEPYPSKPIGEGRASKRFSLWRNAKREEFSNPAKVQLVFERAIKAGICTQDERPHVFRLVASLVATTDKSDNLPGLLTAVLRGDAGHDPWRSRGIEHEETARAWMRSLDCPPEMQRRTANLSESNPDEERRRQREALLARSDLMRSAKPNSS